MVQGLAGKWARTCGRNRTFSQHPAPQGPSHCGLKAHGKEDHTGSGTLRARAFTLALVARGWLGGVLNACFPFRHPWPVCVLWMTEPLLRENLLSGSPLEIGPYSSHRQLHVNLHSESLKKIQPVDL